MDNKILVSSSLIMPRDEVKESSLLVPSGAYLTWMEMLKDEERIANNKEG